MKSCEHAQLAVIPGGHGTSIGEVSAACTHTLPATQFNLCDTTEEAMIHRSISMLMLALVASTAHTQGQALNKTLVHDGITRNYTIYAPSSYSPQLATPLVVNMHAYTLNRTFQMTTSGMNAVAEREGFLVAYPDAVNSDWFGPQDNIEFIDRLLDDIASQYSIGLAARKASAQ